MQVRNLNAHCAGKKIKLYAEEENANENTAITASLYPFIYNIFVAWLSSVIEQMLQSTSGV